MTTKVVILASVPPPHHGQNLMASVLLEGLRAHGAARGVEYFHVDCRFSDDMAEVGRVQPKKIVRLLGYAARTLWHRYRHDATVLYYVPAPAKRAPLYRDWLLVGLCRPFFARTVLHWHATGLGTWLDTNARPWERWISKRVLGRADPSVVLTRFNEDDARRLTPESIVVVPDGIMDPCPDFDTRVAPLRRARQATLREDAADMVRLLFISTCTREKGIFDALDAVVLANGQLRSMGRARRVHLTIAGAFPSAAEQAELKARLKDPQLQLENGSAAASYVGFVSGASKEELFLRSDAICFPVHGPESFGLALVEGMSWGLPALTTRYGGIPELFPHDYPWLVDPNQPSQLADAIVRLASGEATPDLRRHYLTRYSTERFWEAMLEVFA